MPRQRVSFVARVTTMTLAGARRRATHVLTALPHSASASKGAGTRVWGSARAPGGSARPATVSLVAAVDETDAEKATDSVTTNAMCVAPGAPVRRRDSAEGTCETSIDSRTNTTLKQTLTPLSLRQ